MWRQKIVLRFRKVKCAIRLTLSTKNFIRDVLIIPITSSRNIYEILMRWNIYLTQLVSVQSKIWAYSAGFKVKLKGQRKCFVTVNSPDGYYHYSVLYLKEVKKVVVLCSTIIITLAHNIEMEYSVKWWKQLEIAERVPKILFERCGTIEESVSI